MKKGSKFFAAFPGIVFLMVLAGYVLYAAGILSYPAWLAVIIGFALTTLNFIIGIISFRMAVKSSQIRFLAIVAGGIIIRLVFMLGIILIILQFLQISVDVFIFVIFIFYTLYLITEIIYFYLFKGKTH